MEIKKTPLCACGCGRLVRWNKSKWCWSVYLSGHNRRGKPNPCSEETRRKMSEALMGKYRLPREMRVCKCKCGQTFECKTNSNRKYIQGHYTLRGENHPRWINGLKREYPIEFNSQLKQTIRKRDCHICQLCWESEKQNRRKLDVHHIDHNKDNCHPSNLISLCSSCNLRVNVKILKDAWIRFFQRLIGENQLKTSIIEM